MKYHRHKDYGKNTEKYKSLLGLKSKPYDDGRPFVIDEHDLKMIALNLPQRDIPLFKKKFQSGSSSSFRVLQDIEYEKRGRL